jgi:hypothetical protein
METRPDLANAALAVGNVAFEWARLPLRIVVRLPGMHRLAEEGALVRMRVRSRLEGLLDDVLCSPEVERALDRILAGTLPDGSRVSSWPRSRSTPPSKPRSTTRPRNSS